MSHIPYTPGSVEHIIAHDAIEETVLIADVSPDLVAGAKAIAISLTEGGTVNNRSGVLTVFVSMDGGVTFHATNMLIDNVTNSNSETLTRVASKTRAAAGTDLLFLDPIVAQSITHIKTVLAITDTALPTGNFTVDISVKY
jgi:hypothetical protein